MLSSLTSSLCRGKWVPLVTKGAKAIKGMR